MTQGLAVLKRFVLSASRSRHPYEVFLAEIRDVISAVLMRDEISFNQKVQIFLERPVIERLAKHLLDVFKVCLHQTWELSLTSNFVQLLQKVVLASENEVLNLFKFQVYLRRSEVLNQDLLPSRHRR